MIDWRLAMSDIVSGAESPIRTGAQVASQEQDTRIHTLAVHGAFAFIAAIVFGTLSYHPF